MAKSDSLTPSNNRSLAFSSSKLSESLTRLSNPREISRLDLSKCFKTSCHNHKQNETDYRNMLMVLTKRMIETLSLFKVTNMITNEEVIIWINDVIERYIDISVEDMFYFCETIRKGGINSREDGFLKYEKVYNRIDISILNEWIDTYYNAKIQEREYLIKTRKQEQPRSQSSNGLSLDGIIKQINPLHSSEVQSVSYEEMLETMTDDEIDILLDMAIETGDITLKIAIDNHNIKNGKTNFLHR